MTACLQIAEKMKDGALAQQAHMNLGEIQRRKGEHRAAVRHLNSSLSIARRLQDPRAEGDTLVLLALDAEDQNDIERAEASLRSAEALATSLKDRDLQARAWTVRGGLEFKAGRFAAAATLYLRAARVLAGAPSQQLAESLGGALLSAAHRGRLDEQTLEQLLEVSSWLDTDEALLGELTTALPALSEKGADCDVARLAAITLGVALRLVFPGNDEDPDRFAPIVQAGSAAAWWIDADSRREPMLRHELQEIGGKEVAREVMKLVSAAVDAIAEMRAQAGEQDPPAALPHAA